MPHVLPEFPGDNASENPENLRNRSVCAAKSTSFQPLHCQKMSRRSSTHSAREMIVADLPFRCPTEICARFVGTGPLLRRFGRERLLTRLAFCADR